MARILPELTRRLPELSVPVSSGDPESDRFALFESIDGLLTAASRGAPVLLVLDDLHWADKSSLLLLRHLVRSDRPAALLVVATYRETDLARTHPLAELLADLRREKRVERLLLRGLNESDLAALVASRAQEQPPSRVRARTPRGDRGQSLLRGGGPPAPRRVGCAAPGGGALDQRSVRRRTRDPRERPRGSGPAPLAPLRDCERSARCRVGRRARLRRGDDRGRRGTLRRSPTRRTRRVRAGAAAAGGGWKPRAVQLQPRARAADALRGTRHDAKGAPSLADR